MLEIQLVVRSGTTYLGKGVVVLVLRADQGLCLFAAPRLCGSLLTVQRPDPEYGNQIHFLICKGRCATPFKGCIWRFLQISAQPKSELFLLANVFEVTFLG